MMLAVLLLVTVARAGAEECPSGGPVYLAVPGDCSSFRRCEEGRPVPGRCPPGQVFSVERQRCSDPALLGCGSCPADWCNYNCTCLRTDRTRKHCPFRLQFATELALTDLLLQPHCAPEADSFSLGSDKLGQLVARKAAATVSMCDAKAGQKSAPHFADCHRGVRCAADGSEEPLSCPQGSLYHPGLGRCDQPQRVECATAATPRSDCSRDEAPLLSGCHLSCTCEVLRGSCPARLRFAATLTVLDARTQLAYFNGSAVIELEEQFAGALAVDGNTTLVNHCPYSEERRAVYLPDPSDCRRMFRCQHGRETSLSCPGGQHFDPASGTCGAPDPAGCRLLATPPPLVAAEDNIPCPATVACPARSSGSAAHPAHCAFFCECVQGSSTLRACPPGLHFSARTLLCDSPLEAGCMTLCHRLASPVGGMWSRQECITAESMESEECRLECDEEHQLIGSEVIKCTKNGWLGTGGLRIIPSCKTPEEVAEDIINKINGTLSRMNQTNQDTALLFILDESGSVRTPNFEIEKDFVSALVNAFPLSQDRAAGVVSFSRLSAVDISLTETSTCNFLSRLRGIHYSSGRTDIASVLEAAMEEIETHAPNKTTLVFLITDGRSQTDPVAAAQVLRSQDRILFIIGVARYVREQVEPISSTYWDGSKLFFGLPSFRVFKVVADYLKTTYTMGASQECL